MRIERPGAVSNDKDLLCPKFIEGASIIPWAHGHIADIFQDWDSETPAEIVTEFGYNTIALDSFCYGKDPELYSQITSVQDFISRLPEDTKILAADFVPRFMFDPDNNNLDAHDVKNFIKFASFGAFINGATRNNRSFSRRAFLGVMWGTGTYIALNGGLAFMLHNLGSRSASCTNTPSTVSLCAGTDYCGMDVAIRNAVILRKISILESIVPSTKGAAVLGTGHVSNVHVINETKKLVEDDGYFNHVIEQTLDIENSKYPDHVEQTIEQINGMSIFCIKKDLESQESKLISVDTYSDLLQIDI